MSQETKPEDSRQDGSAAADLGDEAAERARATLDHAREDARALVDRARESAMSALDQQKAEAANQIAGVSKALQATADALKDQDLGPIAVYVGRAAESLGSMADALNEQDLPTLLKRTRKMARRQPALFVGGAFAVGFGLARFLKTSAENAQGGAHDGDDGETSGRSGSRGRAASGKGRGSSRPRSGGRGRKPSAGDYEGPQFGEMVGSSAAQGAEPKGDQG